VSVFLAPILPWDMPHTSCVGSDGETANKRLGQGFDMASTSTDAAAVIAQFRREYQAARGSTTSKSGSVY
jgi:hypothetical protein